MSKFDRWDVFMKMLEIIELDTMPEARPPANISEEERAKIINIVQQNNVILEQYLNEELTVNTGDHFENIHQSIIATRGSIATGVIKVRQIHGAEVGDAIERLETAIWEAPVEQLPQEKKEEALQLLAEVTEAAAKPQKKTAVVKALGVSLWEAVKNVDSIKETVAQVWPVVEKLWS
jgi:hypothetical protein